MRSVPIHVAAANYTEYIPPKVHACTCIIIQAARCDSQWLLLPQCVNSSFIPRLSLSECFKVKLHYWGAQENQRHKPYVVAVNDPLKCTITIKAIPVCRNEKR